MWHLQELGLTILLAECLWAKFVRTLLLVHRHSAMLSGIFLAETLDSLLTYPSISAASPGAPIPDSNVSADGVVTITWTPAAGGPPIDVNDA